MILESEENMTENWYTQPTNEVFEELGSGEQGLSKSEIPSRLEKYGRNQLDEKKQKSVLMIFLSQWKDFMTIILLIAAAISAFVAREIADAIVIMILLVINAIIGTVQEVKAQRSMESLKKMSVPNAKVIRDGHQEVVNSQELVPGDLVVLETGDYVPADLRLLEAVNLKIQEAALTGESVPVDKDTAPLAGEVSLGDRVNMAFSSSLITYGRGSGIVIATGMHTEVGKIAGMLHNTEETQTPLQRRLDKLGKILGIAALAVCAVMFVVGLIHGQDWLEMFMSAIALAVAAIPEGLPTVSTIVLALGVQRMVSRNAIVQRMPSVETLGSANVICSDKTGTLTQNQMHVQRYALPGQKESLPQDELQDRELLHAAVLCTDALIENGEHIGDPTETALVEMGLNHQIDKKELEKVYPRVSELPFDSDRKRMTTVHSMPDDSNLIVYTKGGLDEVLAVCTSIRTAEGDRPIQQDDIEQLRKTNEGMAENALRVLGFAEKIIPQIPENLQTFESELTYIGMLGMIDPPRPEAKEAVKKCHTAGIKPVMITGDHPITARAIAKELDILEEGGRTVVGTELEAMSDDELYEQVENISVYARVSPEHKVRIVEAWQKHGDVVAMTGDGVNDAPALKKADIGCAMGKVGTDVAKEAADLVLVDDNFATVVSAVEEGRRIYDNILKCISFLLSCNIGEIITLFVATLFNWTAPLLPIHLLLVNLVTDGLPALALGVDPAAPDVMKRKAQRQSSLFTKGMIWRICYQGVMVGTLTLAAYHLGHPLKDIQTAQTMAFIVLAVSQLVHSFNLRSNDKSIFIDPPFRNMKLVGAAVLSFAIVVACVYVPGLNTTLNLVPLHNEYFFEVIVLAIAPLVIVELMKLFKLNGKD